jgi:hypothetical protein
VNTSPSGRAGTSGRARPDGYAAILFELRSVGKRALREAIIDGWLASPKLAERFAASS